MKKISVRWSDSGKVFDHYRAGFNKSFSRGGVGVEVVEVAGKNYGSISFGQLSGYIAFCIIGYGLAHL